MRRPNHDRRWGTGTLALATATLVTGCGAIGGVVNEDAASPSGPPSSSAARSPAGTAAAGQKPALQRAGACSGGFRSDAQFKITVLGVERHDDFTSLRVQLAYLGPEDQVGDTHLMGPWGTFEGFSLVDSVDKKIYSPIHTHTLGGRGLWWQRGVTYETTIQFDALPLPTGRVAVLTPCAAGAIPGVAVSNGPIPHTPTNPVTPSDEDPQPGTTVIYDAAPPDPGAGPAQSDITTTAATEDSETATSKDGELVALRSDVLFATGKATLTAKAGQVLDAASAEIKQRAEPSRPVKITGHTDSTGEDAHNDDLSQRRADAVQAKLQDELGDTYELEAEGEGEGDPVAEETGSPEEIDAARARNRRVEVSYSLQQAAGQDPTGSAGTGEPTATAAGPRPGPGPVAATREAEGWRLEVHRPYRDGGLLAATVTLTNISADDQSDPPLGGEQVGAQYGGLIWTEPATKRRLLVAQRGQPGVGNVDYLQPTQSLVSAIGYSRDVPEHVWSYYAPPSPKATTLDLEAGPFGTIRGIPIG